MKRLEIFNRNGMTDEMLDLDMVVFTDTKTMRDVLEGMGFRGNPESSIFNHKNGKSQFIATNVEAVISSEKEYEAFKKKKLIEESVERVYGEHFNEF